MHDPATLSAVPQSVIPPSIADLANATPATHPRTTPGFEARLRRLRLSGMLATLPARLLQADAASWTALEFLEAIVTDEIATRDERAFQRRLKQAGILEVKDFHDMNWHFNPLLPRTKLCELATGRFIAEKHNALLYGPPGVGKSHCVTAIAIGAIKAGYTVLIKNVFILNDEFLEADETRTRRALVEKLSSVHLLILEDFGMKTLRATAAEDLLDVIMHRHERVSTLITTNRPTEDWGKFLQDIPAATAILDRFLQHIEVVMMPGRSYRLGERVVPHAAEAECAREAPDTAPEVSARAGEGGSEAGPGAAAPARIRRRPGPASLATSTTSASTVCPATPPVA